MCRADGAGKKLELGSENLKKIRNAMFGYVCLLKAGQEVVKKSPESHGAHFPTDDAGIFE
jgi:hypothetical protein